MRKQQQGSLFLLNIAILGSIILSGCSVKTVNKGIPTELQVLKSVRKNYKINQYAIDKKNEANKEKDEENVFLDRSKGKMNYIGLLLPLSGNFASMGNNVIESVMLALYTLEYQQIRVIPIDTKGTKEGARIAAQKAIDLNVDIVLGPIFSFEVNAIKEMLQSVDIKMITLSNDATLASKGIYVFGIQPEALITTVLSFSNQLGKKNIGLILPSSTYGYRIGKEIKSVMERLEMLNMSTEYYPKDSNLFKAVVDRVSYSRHQSYKVREDGSFYNLNRRDRSKRDEKLEDLPTVKKDMNAVYIDARGNDLDRMIKEIGETSLNTGDVSIFASDMIVNWTEQLNYRFTNVMFPSVVSTSISSAESKFRSYMGYNPVRIGLLGYDAVSTIIYIFKKDKSLTKRMHSKNGYNGIMGDFRFTETGLVQRRFGIYIIKNGYPVLIYNSSMFL